MAHAENLSMNDAFVQQLLLVGDSAGSVILDVGANVGATTEKYLHHFPQSVVHAFEPFPPAFSELQNRYGQLGRVHLHKLAVSNGKSIRRFYVNKNPATNSLLPQAASASIWADQPDSLESQEIIDVEATTLDLFSDQFGIGEIKVLKFDIQGGELLALEGCKSLLAQQRVRLVYSEVMFVPVYDGMPFYEDVSGFLRKFGYSLFNFYNFRYAPSGQLKWGDAIFLSPLLRNQVWIGESDRNQRPKDQW